MSTNSKRRFDDDDFPVPAAFLPSPAQDHPDQEQEFSNYADAAHGPAPTPCWVITDASAVDLDLGVMKSGKEADVSLLRRSYGDQQVLMAVKRYRDAKHRLFHRDAGYLEGRRIEGKNARRSREMRAMAHERGSDAS